MIELAQRLANLSPAKRRLLEQRLKKKPDAAEPVAIVGMSCRFAGANSLHDFQRVIAQGVHAIREVPESRWDLDEFYDPTGEVDGKMSVKWGGFVDNVDQFDPMFFGIAPREARKMDPQQRLLLEVSWEALENGGLSAQTMGGSATGVFVGIGGMDYSKVPIRLGMYYETIDAHSGTGNALSIAANRISYLLDFRGPSMAIDTACSSGLMGVHLAVHSLRNHECDAALAGGVNMILSPETTLAFSKAHMLSPDGCCRPFDAGANGYVRGEGCGMLVLKRLTDAIDNGDNILAVIRASATNQDGRTSGITAPNAVSQVAVIRAALAQAGLTADRVSYVEAHGTGTPLGDPIEMQALGEVYKQRGDGAPPLHVTSVKGNIGHTETVSGVAGLIKAVLLMQARQIYPQMHLQALNPNIKLDGTRIRVPMQLTPWEPSGGTRVAGVSSFGFGGANVHVLIEEASTAMPASSETERPLHIVALSAKNEEALQQQAARGLAWLDEHPEAALADVASTWNRGRAHFNHRLTAIVESSAQLQEKLTAVRDGGRSAGLKISQVKIVSRPKAAFLFTGQGSQYEGMGRLLYETQPTFRKTLDQCDEMLREHLEQPLLSVLYPLEGQPSPLNETAYTQPALFALEYSVASLWRSWGVEPAVALGHSVGEYVAACVAGVFSLADGLKLIATRARLMQQLPRDGQMAVIFAPRDRVERAIAPHTADVSIAAANGPENTVISGRTQVVEALVAKFTDDGIGSQMLTVSHAFHSPLMEPMLDEFERIAAEVQYQRPRVPLVSNLTGELIVGEAIDARYWRDHVRNAVLFDTGMQRLVDENLHAIVEVGPTASLLGMGRRCLPELDVAWLPSLRKGQDDWRTMLGTLSELHLLGWRINWDEFDRPWPRHRLMLPTYPFQRSRHWLPGGKGNVLAGSAAGPTVHPLLGGKIRSALESTVYEVRLSGRSPRYLVDHQVQGSPVTPAAAYVEQGLAVARQLFGEGRHGLQDVAIQQAMFLPDDGSRVVQVTVSPEMGGECEYETYSVPTDSDEEKPRWTMHAGGKILHADSLHTDQPPVIDLDEVRSRAVDISTREEFYQKVAERGLAYGPAFQVLADLHRTRTDALAGIQMEAQVVNEGKDYHLHPALLDAMFQSMAGAVPLEADGSYSPYTYMPTGVGRVTVYGDLTERMYTYAVRTSDDDRPSPETVRGDVLLLDEDGRTLVELSGVTVHRLGRSGGADAAADTRDWLYRIEWQEQPLSAEPTTVVGDWLVFCDASGLGQQLADRIDGRCVLVQPGDAFRAPDADQAAFEIDPLSGDDYRRVMESAFGTDKPECAGVVHLWSLDSERIDDVRRLGSGSALHLIQQLVRFGFRKTPDIWLVTRGAQAVGAGHAAESNGRVESNGQAGSNGRLSSNDTGGATERVNVLQSALWGFGRVAAMENADMRCRLVDLDARAADTVDAATDCGRLLHELAAPSSDDQIALHGDIRRVARLAADRDAVPSVNDQVGMTVPAEGAFRLRLWQAGSFDGLKFESFERATPGPGQVEIEVKATGLNFSDVLKAMGLYPGIKDEIVPLGIECSGVVTAVGAGVDRFQVGDPVMGVAPYSFASHAVTADYALVKKPDTIDDEEAATVPITFLTAYYGLLRLAHLAPGERVLIHAGAGGVGLAAIQICQDVGCEIFCTAGSDEKRDYLRSLGVPHVFNSRTLDFAEQILEVTDREGVDVVLNSLPGDAITKSLGILRAYGRFLEIGKTDIYQNKKIGLLPFQDNLSYFAIDLDRMLRQRPDYIQQMFIEMMTFFDRGVYRPLASTQFPIEDAVGAFRYMAQRKNIGKVVVSIERSAASEASGANESSEANGSGAVLREDGTYLITGGLGALGVQVGRWMAENGAGHLALMSRRAPSDEQQRTIADLEKSGVRVVAVQGDVVDRSSLDQALGQIPADFPPLRGVIHAAGVLDDGIMFDMTLDRLDRAMKPKVEGAWNLHEATLDMPIDHFALFSSVACVLGSPGQSNYAAGNAFLDGLAAYRRSLSLPATSINWGPWAGSGMAAGGELDEQMKAKGMALIPPDNGLEIFGAALSGKTANFAVMDVRWSDMMRLMSGRQPALLERFADAAEDDGTAAESQVDHAFLAELATTDDRTDKLRGYFALELARIMGIEADNLDLDQPLSTFGLDSLMAMELKNNLESRLAFTLPMQKFMEGPSVTSLAEAANELIGLDETAGRAGAGKNVWSPLIPLQPQGDPPPMFCIHPVGGDVRCYFDLSRHLTDRPVYAVRAGGVEKGSPSHDSIPEMARFYLDAIRDEQPDGPYYLAGWSTGGIFAYEMAQQLRSQQIEVAPLLMFDSPMPSIFKDVDLTDDARFLFDLVNFSNYFANAGMTVSYEVLKALSPDERIELALSEAKKHGVMPPDVSTDHVRRLIDVCKGHSRGIMAYEPGPIDVPLHLFRPEDTSVLAEASGQDVAGDLGWERLEGNRLTEHRISGHHFSMMTGDHAAELAEAVRKVLVR